MNILLLGSGGREHALAWKISQSKQCTELFIAPGNAGTAQHGTNLDLKITDFEAVKKACRKNKINLLVVGPEEPLVNGIVDFLKEDKNLAQLLIIGPSKKAAQLEGSKAFAKAFMQRHGIPTAAYREFTAENFEDGIQYLKQHALPIVLKADGLAAGKGVVICMNHVEAISEFELMIQRSKFGEAGKKVVVEEFLEGIEVSVFALTDGQHFVLLPEAKDYKRIGEGDKGANTGGMGAISPVPFVDDAFLQQVIRTVVRPTINGLQEEALDYNGFVFFGLMKVDEQPFVIEYNCRMGDPETEAVIPRIQNDLVELLSATAEARLDTVSVDIDPRHACTIVVASGGYPNDFQKGLPITGMEQQNLDNILLFHSGTRETESGLVTNGGRVCCVTALASNLEQAIDASRKRIGSIKFDEKYFRRDIGYEFVR